MTDDVVWLSGDVTRLGSQFTELAGALATGPDTPIDPQRVVQFALRAVAHADHCGLTLLRRQRPPTTVAATDDLCERVDAIQYRLRESPCLDAAEDAVVALPPTGHATPGGPGSGQPVPRRQGSARCSAPGCCSAGSTPRP